MRKYLTIYEEAVSHMWLCKCSILNFPVYEENFIFFFISVLTNIFVRAGLQLDGGPEQEGGGAPHACCQQFHASLLLR
jgi:hypothetical protein